MSRNISRALLLIFESEFNRLNELLYRLERGGFHVIRKGYFRLKPAEIMKFYGILKPDVAVRSLDGVDVFKCFAICVEKANCIKAIQRHLVHFDMPIHASQNLHEAWREIKFFFPAERAYLNGHELIEHMRCHMESKLTSVLVHSLLDMDEVKNEDNLESVICKLRWNMLLRNAANVPIVLNPQNYKE